MKLTDELPKPKISSDKDDHDSIIEKYYKYMQVTVLTCVLLCVLFIAVLFISYWSLVVDFFIFFEKADLARNYVSNIFISFNSKDILPLAAIVFFYLYLFEFVKRKHIYTFDDASQEGKYFNFLVSVFALLNFAALLFFIPYLLIVKEAYLEAASLVLSYLFIQKIVLNLLQIYPKILFDYYKLTNFSSYSLKVNRQFYYNKFNKLKFELLEKIKRLDLQEIASNEAELKSSMRVFEYFMIEATMKITSQRTLIMRGVSFIAIISIFFTIKLDYNLLSVFYLQVIFLLYYFVLGIVLIIPKRTNNIFLTNGEEVTGYIVEDSPNGYVIVIDSTNNAKKIFKSSILFVE